MGDGNRVAGNWRLTSAELHTGDQHISYPFGKDPTGYLILLANGWVAWAMMRLDRPPFASQDPLHATEAECAGAYRSYFSYNGRYYVDGEFLVMDVDMCLFPNWTDTRQVRVWTREGAELLLRTLPMNIGGTEEVGYFRFAEIN